MKSTASTKYLDHSHGVSPAVSFHKKKFKKNHFHLEIKKSLIIRLLHNMPQSNSIYHLKANI